MLIIFFVCFHYILLSCDFSADSAAFSSLRDASRSLSLYSCFSSNFFNVLLISFYVFFVAWTASETSAPQVVHPHERLKHPLSDFDYIVERICLSFESSVTIDASAMFVE